ncbi:MAG: transcriptional repressor [Syntrophorhabdaceae bacterium]|nr:transcriptional repressor [Syntrophorhabdaceae bacterium]MDD4195133.1 transcriptional repressor [Syntrophorhabdaceae bacterium]
MKMTPQRIAIMKYLEGNVTHPSAGDIYSALHGQFPTMSLATVYNTMETLKDQGRVIELSIDPAKKRFDPNTEPHHHLICIKCKVVVDIFVEFPMKLPEDERYGFEIIGNRVDFYGICKDCAVART